MAKKKDASTTLISELADTSVLRRSGRETPPPRSSSSKKQATSPGPLNTRKSERIEKQTTTSPSRVKKKPERIAKQMGSSPLRRSDRGKKLVEVPDLPNIKSKKAISSKQSAGEGDVINEDKKNQSQDLDVGVGKRKRFTAIRYKALFKPQRIRIESDDDENAKCQANASSNEDVDKKLKSQNSLRIQEAPPKAFFEENLMDLDQTEDGGCLQTEDGGCPQTKPLDNKSIDNGNVEKQISGNFSPSNRYIADSNNDIINTSSPRINHEENQQELESCHKVTVLENNNLQNCGSIFNSSKFAEFWVPVEISNVQLEQYCANLLSNVIALRSSSKSDTLGALKDILIANRKCCNHPYIVDPKLQQLLMKDMKPSMLLDVGIKTSGKLQFLDFILPEVQKRQLKVLILFQLTSGTLRDKGYISLGDILVDYVHQRFGQNSYEYVDGLGNVSSTKQAAISIFNKEKGRFIFLLESRACHPSIKLSSVDIIIIFDSDLQPANDLRALQKIHIDSHSEEQIMVFRLYCSSTLEEKILKLAEQNVAIDTRSQSLRSNYDALLMWGASDLFKKLTDFHKQSVADISSQESFLKDVVEEFVCIISDKSKSKDTSKSIITRLQNGGKSLPLHSEMKTCDGDPPHIFWSNLLGGLYPIWKFVSESTPRQRKRPNYFLDSSSEGASVDAGGVKTRRKTTINYNTTEPAKLKPVTEEGEIGSLSGGGGSGFPAHYESQSLSGDQFWSSAVTNEMSLYDVLKPTVFELCNILKFSEDVKALVDRFLKYVLARYKVLKDETSTLQAFMISLCCIGSSLAKLKIDRRKSLAVAKKHFDFICTEGEIDSVDRLLQPVKEMFLLHLEIPTDALKDGIIPELGSQGMVRLEEEAEEWQEHIQSESSNHEEEANRCKNQIENLSCNEDQQEFDTFNKEWENKRVSLVKNKQVEKALICTLYRHNHLIRSEKLETLDKKFAHNLEQHKRQGHTHLEDLTAKLVSLHGENQVVAAASGQGNDMESTGSHTSGEQTTKATVILIEEAPALQIYNDAEVDDVSGKVDLGVPEVASHQEDATATSSSPNGSHADEQHNETGVNVESGDMGMLAGDCNNENADTSSHAIQDRGPEDGDVAPTVPAEMRMPAGNSDKENALICPSDILHAGEEDHNKINLADSAEMGKPPGSSNDEISPDDASHVAAEEHNNDSCGSSSNPPSAAAVSQDNTALVEPVASVAIILEIQNGSLVESRIEDKEGEASPSLLAEVNFDNVQALGDGCEVGEIVPSEDSLHDTRNGEQLIVSDGYLEQRGDVDGEPQPSSVTALNMFDNLNNRFGSRTPNQTVDPLQAEVERLYEVKDTVTKFHEETKQRLTSECEKEIAEMTAQIRLKYEGKCQEAEAAYESKKKELETNINRVIMNRILAEAFRSKCQDLTAPPHSSSAAPGTPQVSQAGLMQQLHRFSGQPLIGHNQVAASSSPAQYSGSQQIQPMPPRPPLQIVHQPAALFSSRTTPSSHNTNIRSPPFATHVRPSPNIDSPIINSMSTTQLSNTTPSTTSSNSRTPPSLVNPSITPTTTRPPPTPPHIITPSITPTTTRLPPAINSSSMPNRSPPSINSISMSAANLRISTETRGQAPHLRPSVNNGEIFRAPAPHLRPSISSEIRAPAPHLRPMGMVSSEIRAPAPHIRPFRSLPPPELVTQQRMLQTSHLPLTSTNSQPQLSKSSLPPEPCTASPPQPPASSSSWSQLRSHSPQQHQPSSMPATSTSSSHTQLPQIPIPPSGSPNNLENAGHWHNILTPPPDLISEIDVVDITDFIQEGNAGSCSAHDLVCLSDDD